MNDWIQKNKLSGINVESDFENLTEKELRLLLKSSLDLSMRLVKNIETLTKTQIDMIERINILTENQKTLLEYMESSGSLLKILHSYKDSMIEMQNIQDKRIDLVIKHLGV